MKKEIVYQLRRFYELTSYYKKANFIIEHHPVEAATRWYNGDLEYRVDDLLHWVCGPAQAWGSRRSRWSLQERRLLETLNIP